MIWFRWYGHTVFPTRAGAGGSLPVLNARRLHTLFPLNGCCGAPLSLFLVASYVFLLFIPLSAAVGVTLSAVAHSREGEQDYSRLAVSAELANLVPFRRALVCPSVFPEHAMCSSSFLVRTVRPLDPTLAFWTTHTAHVQNWR